MHCWAWSISHESEGKNRGMDLCGPHPTSFWQIWILHAIFFNLNATILGSAVPSFNLTFISIILGSFFAMPSIKGSFTKNQLIIVVFFHVFSVITASFSEYSRGIRGTTFGTGYRYNTYSLLFFVYDLMYMLDVHLLSVWFDSKLLICIFLCFSFLFCIL